MSEAALSYCAREVRRNDPERFLTCLFAPAERREALFALYAFNQEIAKTRSVVSEPLLGEIRLTWWRDAIGEIYQGQPRQHEVVQELAKAVAAYGLTRAHFDRMIEARAQDLTEEPPADMPALLAYAEGTSSTLTALCLEVLGAPASEAATPAGIAVALTGLVRAIPFHARDHWVNIPASLLREHAVDIQALYDLRKPDGLRRCVETIADAARENRAAARAMRGSVPKPALAALLPLTLADAHLTLLAKNGHDVYDPRLGEKSPLASWRLTWAALRGRY